MPVITLRELAMLQIRNTITDKPDWLSKVFDDNIVEKWTEEALCSAALDCTPAMMDWVVAELQCSRMHGHGGVHSSGIYVFNGDVVKNDRALPESFAFELQKAVKVLEDVPDLSKNCHPGSNGRVLDLVHPSLFPLVYGRTRVLESGVRSLEDCILRCGEGVVIPIPGQQERGASRGDFDICFTEDARVEYTYDPAYSQKFQWLPCEVKILDSGQTKITSYINGLHPQHHERLYNLIEQVIAAAIPSWEVSLAPAFSGHWPLRMHYVPPPFRDESPQIPIIKPDVGQFHPVRNWAKFPKLNFRRQFARQGLQVIVKLANIVLTPERPDYPGGSWHLEGQLNEHICATAIYYYSNENIQPSRLNFRQHCDPGSRSHPLWIHDQWDTKFLKEVYGCTNFAEAIQEVGGVETRQGRLIAFPNILQHQVQPFGLEDPSKPGHRKILALFLVDPYIKVLSTANIPPQRVDWWAECIQKLDTPLNKLPAEIRALIFDLIEDDFPVGMDEAKELREELMEERKSYEFQHDESFKSVYFSLCEH